jgi:cytochrome o ubiquinol oxidase subunit 1
LKPASAPNTTHGWWFYLAFMPLYVLGLLGMTRRLQHYDNLDWRPWLVVAALGVVVILAGIVCQVVQLVVSIRARDQFRVTNDPWNGRRLEWSTASLPPAWNFAVLPRVTGLDAHWRSNKSTDARSNQPAPTLEYKPIEVPKSSAIGFINAFFAVVTGFALIWYIWWMAGLGLVGAFVALLLFAFRDEDEIEIPAEQIALLERHHQTEVA